MTQQPPSSFSAAPSATGYLYQCRYGLLEALRRLRDEQDFHVCIETLDDVVFQKEGHPPDLLQTKHHINRSADLTDASGDLWKTIRIWCEGLVDGSLTTESRFVLVTTASAAPNSAATLLKPGDARDVSAALARLRSTAATSTNKSNTAAYRAFNSLAPERQEALFQAVWLVDAIPTIASLDTDIRQAVFYAVERHLLDAFLTRLEGWWFRRIIQHLAADQDAPIHSSELLVEIDQLRDQLRQDNLPVDEAIEQMKVDATGYENRVFVHQLKMIDVGAERVVRAIHDYYRAFAQRSRWVREELVGIGDLERYERQLRDTWRSHFLIVRDELGESAAEQERKRLARKIYAWVETGDLPRIRPRCTDGFVARGSYQIMADSLKVGWHPDFEERLRRLLGPAEAHQ